MATSTITSKADYVVEQGTSGIWTFRKWKSGIVECWCGTSTGTSYTMSANGNIYNSSVITINLPSGLFSSAPLVQIQTRIGGGQWIKAGATTASSVAYQILRTNNTVQELSIAIYCIGS